MHQEGHTAGQLIKDKSTENPGLIVSHAGSRAMGGHHVRREYAKSATINVTVHQCRGDNARKQSYRGVRDVYRADYEGHWDEGSATISVQIEERTTRALLDTGARINVMDVSTIKELKLEGKLIHTTGCIFGVCKTPVQVLGYLEASIKVPNESTRLVRIQVLEGNI